MASTQHTYKTALKRFHDICACHNVSCPFPLCEKLLCYFAVYLATHGLAPQSFKTYLSATQGMHISLGFPGPTMQLVLAHTLAHSGWNPANPGSERLTIKACQTAHHPNHPGQTERSVGKGEELGEASPVGGVSTLFCELLPTWRASPHSRFTNGPVIMHTMG